MVFWMSAELMHDCSHDYWKIQCEIEPRINKLIKECTLGKYVKWYFIVMILNEKGPPYKERVRRSLKDMDLEFRLKVAHHDFIEADYNGKKKLMLQSILRSLDLMAKWKDIKVEERGTIRKLIEEEYRDILNL